MMGKKKQQDSMAMINDEGAFDRSGRCPHHEGAGIPSRRRCKQQKTQRELPHKSYPRGKSKHPCTHTNPKALTRSLSSTVNMFSTLFPFKLQRMTCGTQLTEIIDFQVLPDGKLDDFLKSVAEAARDFNEKLERSFGARHGRIGSSF